MPQRSSLIWPGYPDMHDLQMKRNIARPQTRTLEPSASIRWSLSGSRRRRLIGSRHLENSNVLWAEYERSTNGWITGEIKEGGLVSCLFVLKTSRSWTARNIDACFSRLGNRDLSKGCGYTNIKTPTDITRVHLSHVEINLIMMDSKQTEILSPPDAGKVEKEAPILPDVISQNVGWALFAEMMVKCGGEPRLTSVVQEPNPL
jgi:hypothetical protein